MQRGIRNTIAYTRYFTDSLRNDENRLSIMRLQAGYEFDKKEEQLKLEQVKKEAGTSNATTKSNS